MEQANPSQNEGQSGQPQQTASTATAPTAAAGKNTLMAALSYVGILVVIPFISAKDDPFVKFHIKQGLILLIIEIALWTLGSMVYMMWTIMQFINLAIVVMAVIGIVNAVKGVEKELPFIGHFGSQFKF